MSKKRKNKEAKRFPSELRFDIASKDWVVIATGRAKRPEVFKKAKQNKERASKKDCPFCKIETQKRPVLIFSSGKKVPFAPGARIPKNWSTLVIPNKYPAFIPEDRLEKRTEGDLYQSVNAVGFHEVVVTKDHDKQLPLLSLSEIKEVLDVYQARYLDLIKDPFVKHISIFHNHGREAGASIYHPHSQIITTPLIDADLKNALSASRAYFKKHKTCVYCKMAKWERRVKKRIVFENKDFLVICPFASKMAFQLIVSPKKHLSHFERISEQRKETLAEAFKQALHRLYKGLNNPAYNFYLHTAPCDNRDYSFYHWHWTILPKTSIYAGFELGASMEISTIEPEKAAAYLRRQ